ncbi:MAG TPA: sialidase family protein [Acidimicrobiales bacterium]|nr:sialidase family protein [Acidimicrobiales bacterium]
MARFAVPAAALGLVLLAAGSTPASSAAQLPTFTSPTRVDDPKVWASTNAKYVSEPATAIDTNGVRYVAYQRGSQLAATTDGGRTWTHKGGKGVLTKNLNGCQTSPPLGDIGDVELAADQSGRLYFADLQSTVGAPANSGVQPVVATSDDGFATWQGQCSANQAFSVDREWMAAFTPPGKTSADSRVYMTYHDFGPNTMWVNASKDGGKTWSLPVDIVTDPTAALNSFCDTVPAGIAVDPTTGWVYVGWTAGAGPATNAGTGCNYTQGTVFNNFFVAVSKDEGATWSTTHAFAGPDYTQPEPADLSEIFGSIVVDRAGGVSIAFPAFINGEFGAYLATSPKADGFGNLHFGPPVKVNGPDTHTAFFTRLVAGDAGRLNMIYLGSPVKNVIATAQNKATFTGADPNQPNCTPEVGTNVQGLRFPGKPCQMPATAPWYLYLAQTLDGGATFTNQKLDAGPVHVGDICTLGIFCLPGDDRDLADVNDIRIDRTGGFQVAYTWEPADASRTEIRFQCQTGGPGLLAGQAVLSCLDASSVRVPGPGGAAGAAAGRTGALPATGRNGWPAAAGVVLLALAVALRGARRFS